MHTQSSSGYPILRRSCDVMGIAPPQPSTLNLKPQTTLNPQPLTATGGLNQRASRAPPRVPQEPAGQPALIQEPSGSEHPIIKYFPQPILQALKPKAQVFSYWVFWSLTEEVTLGCGLEFCQRLWYRCFLAASYPALCHHWVHPSIRVV